MTVATPILIGIPWDANSSLVDAALAAFERAAGANADEMAGPYLLAETLATQGRLKEAERWAEEAFRRSPSEPRVPRLLESIRATRPR